MIYVQSKSSQGVVYVGVKSYFAPGEGDKGEDFCNLKCVSKKKKDKN